MHCSPFFENCDKSSPFILNATLITSALLVINSAVIEKYQKNQELLSLVTHIVVSLGTYVTCVAIVAVRCSSALH